MRKSSLKKFLINNFVYLEVLAIVIAVGAVLYFGSEVLKSNPHLEATLISWVPASLH